MILTQNASDDKKIDYKICFRIQVDLMHLYKKKLRLRYECITIIQYIHTDLKTITFPTCLTSDSSLLQIGQTSMFKGFASGFQDIETKRKEQYLQC